MVHDATLQRKPHRCWQSRR